MERAGRSPEQIEAFRAALMADNGPECCPSCGPGDPTFRRARPGERLTYYCLACGAEGPPEAVEIGLDVLAALREIRYG